MAHAAHPFAPHLVRVSIGALLVTARDADCKRIRDRLGLEGERHAT
jgi:hypothetical protein